MTVRILCLSALTALPSMVAAQAYRELGSHEHGVTTAQIALDGDRLVVELYAPGLDLVGFEHEAESAADRDAVAGAIGQLSRPEGIVALPGAADCRVTGLLANLQSGHDDHGDAHTHGGEHDHDAPAEEGSKHSAFHARYEFACGAPEQLVEIGFPFFDMFAGSVEIEAQFVTASGAGTAEIGRDAARLRLD